MVVLGRQRHAEAFYACEDEFGRRFEVRQEFLEMDDSGREGGGFRGHFERKGLAGEEAAS